MAALGSALRARGHTVVFVHLLDMEAAVRAAGLDYLPYGQTAMPLGSMKRENEEMGKLSGLASLRWMVNRATEGVRLQLRELPDLLRTHGPFDIILADTAQLAPVVVGEHLGIPVVSVDLLPPAVFESSAPPWIFAWRYSEAWWARPRNWLGNQIFLLSMAPLRSALAQQRREWGMPPNVDAQQLFSTRLRLSHMPAALDFPRRWLPPNFHYAGPFISAASRVQVTFPWERLDGRPLVYASLGTLNNSNLSTLRSIGLAFALLPSVQLVLSTGGGLAPEELGLDGLERPPVVVRMAPQIALIEKAVLVVTHAGINTMMEALLNGRPMVAIPIAADQPGNARRLERLGLGEIVFPSELTVERLRAAAEKVLGEQGYTERAKDMQTHLQGLRGLDRGVELVEGELNRAQPTAGA